MLLLCYIIFVCLNRRHRLRLQCSDVVEVVACAGAVLAFAVTLQGPSNLPSPI
jgi:hypothetical protein